MTKRWDEHRSIIVGLYKEQHKPLREVRRLMAERYGFRASTRAYRSRFDRWGVYKYNCRRRGGSTSGSAQDGSPRHDDDDDDDDVDDDNGCSPRRFGLKSEEDEDDHNVFRCGGATTPPPTPQSDHTTPLAAQAVMPPSHQRYFRDSSSSSSVMFTAADGGGGGGGGGGTLVSPSPGSVESISSGSTMSRNSSISHPAAASGFNSGRHGRPPPPGMDYAAVAAATSPVEGQYGPFEAYQRQHYHHQQQQHQQQQYPGGNQYHTQHRGGAGVVTGLAPPQEAERQGDRGRGEYMWAVPPAGYHVPPGHGDVKAPRE